MRACSRCTTQAPQVGGLGAARATATPRPHDARAADAPAALAPPVPACPACLPALQRSWSAGHASHE